jgi:hypothetical protein
MRLQLMLRRKIWNLVATLLKVQCLMIRQSVFGKMRRSVLRWNADVKLMQEVSLL